jgi:hypothetical protein
LIDTVLAQHRLSPLNCSNITYKERACYGASSSEQAIHRHGSRPNQPHRNFVVVWSNNPLETGQEDAMTPPPQAGRSDISAHGMLEMWLNHVNVSVPRDMRTTAAELITALKDPRTALRRGGHVAHALSAFMLETEEIALLRIAREGEVSWADLDRAAQATLRDDDPKKDWIHDAAVARGAIPAR